MPTTRLFPLVTCTGFTHGTSFPLNRKKWDFSLLIKDYPRFFEAVIL